MSESDRARAEGRLHALRAGFVVRLHERLAEIDALVRQAREGSPEGALDRTIAAAHRLAGTAGSYGHAEVGEAAAALEDALQGIVAGTTTWDEVLTALAHAHACARTSTAGMG